MADIIHIMGGDHREAEHLAAWCGLNRGQWKNVRDDADLRGYPRGGTLLLYRNWRDRRDCRVVRIIAKEREFTIVEIFDTPRAARLDMRRYRR